jgi:hypothetical protein
MALLKEFRDGKELEMRGKQELDDKVLVHMQVLGGMGRDDMEQGWDDKEQVLGGMGRDDMELA